MFLYSTFKSVNPMLKSIEFFMSQAIFRLRVKRVGYVVKEFCVFIFMPKIVIQYE